MADADPKDPAALAADAAADVQQLAAILTHSGANPAALAGLHKIVAVLNGIHQQLASAPLPGQAPQAGPPQAAPPPGPPQAQAPPPGAPAAKPESPQKLHTRAALHAASAALQASMAASAKK